MKAVVLRRPGEPEELRLEETADPEGSADDVVVRVRASAVCGRDLIDRRGGFPMMKLPTILGHELAGEVVRVGETAAATSDFRPGDRVVNLHRPTCGACPRCRGGEPLLCERAWQSLGHTVDGAYAELCAVHPRALVRIPDGVSFEAASTLMCTAGVALHALRTKASLRLGETVLVTGASGGVGAMAVQIARRMGARVIATTTSPAKADAIAALGAHEVVVAPSARFHDQVKQKTDGGADVCLELTGSATFTAGLKSLRRGGRCVVVGNISAQKTELNLGAVILNGYVIAGSASCTHRDLEDVLSLAATGEIKPVIDRTLPLADAAVAHRLLADRAVVGRIVLVP